MASSPDVIATIQSAHRTARCTARCAATRAIALRNPDRRLHSNGLRESVTFMQIRPSAQSPGADAESQASTNIAFETVYDRLKLLARHQLSSGPGNTLNTTALVHELYLRMEADRDIKFEQSAQYFAYAARAMRHLLINRARDRMRQKVGGDWVRVTTLSGAADPALAMASAEQALAIDEALSQLEKFDPRAARVFELRYFTGLAAEQIGELLDITRRTVDRDWRFARAFLLGLLNS